MTDMISISRASLETIYKTIGAHLGQEVAAALSKTIKTAKPAKAEKKPRANAGQGTAWSAFSSKIQHDHKAEVDAVKAEAAAKRKAAKEAGAPVPEDTQGAHLHWCSRYKLEHEAEWLAFKAAWEVDHPKSERASAAASVADDASVAGSEAVKPAAKKRGIKKDSECSPEELAARKAKRAAAKAAKAGAAAPDAEPASSQDQVEEEAVVELPAAEEESASVEDSASVKVDAAEDGLIDWVSPKGVTYLRVGHLDAEGDGVWNEGNWLWAKAADGSRGAYAGILLASGKIDSSPAVMADPPELE